MSHVAIITKSAADRTRSRVSPARWVEDGKVWSSSGVTAGIDLALAFVEAKYPNGTAMAQLIADTMEQRRTTDWRDDPFADRWDVPPTN